VNGNTRDCQTVLGRTGGVEAGTKRVVVLLGPERWEDIKGSQKGRDTDQVPGFHKKAILRKKESAK